MLSIHRSLSGQSLGVLLLMTGMLSGCASMFSDSPSRSSASGYRTPNAQAAYNRPYTVRGVTYVPLATAAGYRETGTASWYGSESGSRTAMGARFAPQGLTAAHKTLPLPSKVRVTNLHNGRAVDVVVNDRGPFKKGRLIDLSHGAAKKIGLQGVGKVRVEYLDSKLSQR
ncbi:septal ring lytic transglycosylase RlpA family protein [Nitrosomonas sp. JL21]|uniref:septal ring lytic transglycosylase RlpA family protein n=1 Tax=Nitrosomonas sp. JL21 TaxID=153949 RepID=UPI0013686A48|nr:septal ring lytic transglycosylase RlpA family protein [Nitrosomonas sp. JL21]MBL8498083.1 septal ring lytic transglycosylase RlpA family protein [Nitrosomonas sp.]MXS76404.1 septal ring lytic transglycosylase RlpA family protein [Nitrosomonas sp. JL21]